MFLADPQLIDPHTYPGRPWPLSSLTFLHTDNYLKRSYIQLQKALHPDTLFFLGDLFDGGREWKTAHGNTVDPSWANGLRPSGEQAYTATWGKRYGEDFWLKEYDRFGRIFYKLWNIGGDEAGPGQRGRKIISSLPGNHDLGFGAQIKIPIRNRFETYFGEGNRVDVVGNHTFVSVDTVSLSAGTSEHSTPELIQPSEDFLKNIQATKRKAVARELAFQAGEVANIQYPHVVEDLEKVDFKKIPSLDPGPESPDFPTILLTHVPLYRSPGTPCGPKREHWPPATPPKGQTAPVNPDERNAISVSGGYQYQNVLNEDDSVMIVSSIGNVVSVFSGDDHDYCEIVHPANKNHAREITVKSMSWAMGVSKPGFLMLSMWNPVGPNGQPLRSMKNPHGDATQQAMTMESHLCLLPDQISILIRYGCLLAFTFLILIIRAALTPILKLEPFSSPASESEQDLSLLPVTNKDTKRREGTEPEHNRSSHSSTSSTTSNNLSNLAPRTTASRTRSVSPSGYGLPASQVRFATPPLINHASNANPERWASDDDYGRVKTSIYTPTAKKRKPVTGLALVWREAWTSIWRVAWIVLLGYLYLIYYG